MAAGGASDDWDPFWFQLWLDSTEEPFYRTSEYGPTTITVEPYERTFRVRMPMQNAGSQRVEVEASISLPADSRSE